MTLTVQPKSEAPAESGRKHPLLRLPAWLCIGLLLLVILCFGLIRYRLRGMPLERDEGEYTLSGQLMLQGILPYKLAYNMKLPGTMRRSWRYSARRRRESILGYCWSTS